MGFDAGSIEAHMKLDRTEFDDQLDAVLARIDEAEKKGIAFKARVEQSDLDKDVDEIEVKKERLKKDVKFNVEADILPLEEKAVQAEEVKKVLGDTVTTKIDADIFPLEEKAAEAETIVEAISKQDAVVNFRTSGFSKVVAESAAVQALTGHASTALQLLQNGASPSEALATISGFAGVGSKGAASYMSQAMAQFNREATAASRAIDTASGISQKYLDLVAQWTDNGAAGIISGGGGGRGLHRGGFTWPQLYTSGAIPLPGGGHAGPALSQDLGWLFGGNGNLPMPYAGGNDPLAAILNRAGGFPNATEANSWERSAWSVLDPWGPAATGTSVPRASGSGILSPLSWFETGTPPGWGGYPAGSTAESRAAADRAARARAKAAGSRAEAAAASDARKFEGTNPFLRFWHAADNLVQNFSGGAGNLFNGFGGGVPSIFGNVLGKVNSTFGSPESNPLLSSVNLPFLPAMPAGFTGAFVGLGAQLGTAIASSLAGVLSGFIIGVPGLVAGGLAAYGAFSAIDKSKNALSTYNTTTTALKAAGLGPGSVQWQAAQKLYTKQLGTTADQKAGQQLGGAIKAVKGGFHGVSETLVPVLGNLFQAIGGAGPSTKGFVQQSAAGVGDFLGGITSSLKGPGFGDFMGKMAKDVRPIMDEFGSTMLNLIKIVGYFGLAFFPLADSVGKWFVRWTGHLADFLSHFKTGKGTVDQMAGVWRTLGGIWTNVVWPGIKKIYDGLMPLGAFMVKLIGWLAPVVGWFIKFIPPQLITGLAAAAAGVGLVAAAFFVFDIATGPIGLIIIGVGLLIAGIILLATHWKQVWGAIKNWMHEAWDFIQKHFMLIAIALGPIGPLFLALVFIGKHFKQIWTDIKNWALDAWHFLDDKVFHPITDAWHALATALQSLGIDINPFHWLLDAFHAVAGPLLHAYNDTLGQLPGFGTVDIPWEKSAGGHGKGISQKNFDKLGSLIGAKSGTEANVGGTIYVNFHGAIYADNPNGMKQAAAAGVLAGVTAALSRGSMKAKH